MLKKVNKVNLMNQKQSKLLKISYNSRLWHNKKIKSFQILRRKKLMNKIT